EGGEFIRRFLVHVLPEGFHRIRYYGFLGNCQRARKLALCRELLRMAPPTSLDSPADDLGRIQTTASRSWRECPSCGGGSMVVIACVTSLACRELVADTS